MIEKKKRDLRGAMTCCGCVRFVNKYRDKVGCFGGEMLDIWSEAMQRVIKGDIRCHNYR